MKLIKQKSNYIVNEEKRHRQFMILLLYMNKYALIYAQTKRTARYIKNKLFQAVDCLVITNKIFYGQITRDISAVFSSLEKKSERGWSGAERGQDKMEL